MWTCEIVIIGTQKVTAELTAIYVILQVQKLSFISIRVCALQMDTHRDQFVGPSVILKAKLLSN
jgi:hypothetical protein